MKTRAGTTGALAVLALTMAVPMGGMQQNGGLSQDPLGPAIPPASQDGIPPMTNPSQQQQQSQPGTTSSPRPGRPNLPSVSDDMPNPLAKTPEEQVRQQNAIHQKEIAKDTDRLLDLALELKEEVNKSNKDTLSLSVVRKAEEIERLARQVKEKMRN